LVDSIFARLRSWLRAVTRRDSVEEEMAAELACHLECLTADLVHAGMTPQEAERQARLQLGTALTHKEGMRASLGLRWWDELRADVRFGMRMLRKNPGRYCMTGWAFLIPSSCAFWAGWAMTRSRFTITRVSIQTATQG